MAEQRHPNSISSCSGPTLPPPPLLLLLFAASTRFRFLVRHCTAFLPAGCLVFSRHRSTVCFSVSPWRYQLICPPLRPSSRGAFTPEPTRTRQYFRTKLRFVVHGPRHTPSVYVFISLKIRRGSTSKERWPRWTSLDSVVEITDEEYV